MVAENDGTMDRQALARAVKPALEGGKGAPVGVVNHGSQARANAGV